MRSAGSKHIRFCFNERRCSPSLSYTPQQNRNTHIRHKDRTTHGHTAWQPAPTASLQTYTCVCSCNSPWFCGSAPYPARIQECAAPWTRHTETQLGPLFRSCTTSRCSPSRKRRGHTQQKIYRGERDRETE